jgi:excinuclease UvrABC nuclease subunit
MKLITTAGQLPNCPTVYAMYGAHGSDLDVAYVGIEGHLKRRIEQHLIRRDSSVTTGTSVVSLNPELVTKLHWWEHEPSFS